MRKKRMVFMLLIMTLTIFMTFPAFAGWQTEDDGRQRYLYSDGSYPKDVAVGFTRSSDQSKLVYVFDKDGYLVKDQWYHTSDQYKEILGQKKLWNYANWYLLKPNGEAVLTYAFENGNWYYFSNSTGALYTQYSWQVDEKNSQVNGDVGGYYDVANKIVRPLPDFPFIELQQYGTDASGKITSGWKHVLATDDPNYAYSGSGGASWNGTNSGGVQENFKTLSNDEVFAIADQYLQGIPNPRHYDVTPILNGYYANYLTDNGIYTVVIVRDALNAVLGGNPNSFYYEKGFYQ